jgi:iron complex outermembrane receptor protein
MTRNDEARLRVWRAALLGGASFTGAAGLAASAFAQDAPAQGAMLEEIVVTAQKREQSIQVVPIAVTALTQSTIEANRITNVTELSGLAPGLIARPSAGSIGTTSFSMRGITSYGVVPGSDKEISIYLDGVYIGATRGSIFDLPDIERLEVLRGPQGTLFGRNATAGAISVVTRNPTGQFGLQQQITGGNYGQFRWRTSVDLPSVGPFSAYITYVHDQRHGDVDNLGAGTLWDRTRSVTGIGGQASPERLGDKNRDAWFLAARFDSTDNFSMTYKLDWSREQFTPDARGTTAYNPNAPLIGPLLTALFTSQAGAPFGPTPLVPSALRPEALNAAFSTPGHQYNTGHSLTTEWRLNDHLSLKNITAYRTYSVFAAADLAGAGGLILTQQAVVPLATFFAFSGFPVSVAPSLIGPIAQSLQPHVGDHFTLFTGNNSGSGNQFSTETQLNFESKPVTLTAGVIYYRSDEAAGGPPNQPANFILTTVPANGVLPLGGQAISYNKSKSLAAYTQVELHLTSQLDLVGGARITKDEKWGDYVFAPTGSFNLTNLPFTYRNTKPNYSIGLNYHPTDAILLYGKYSTGFMSGGSVSDVGFAPETVRSWEGGVKADLLDRRLRTNLALWDAKYEHIQSAQSGQNVGRPELSTVVIDNGGLKAKGAELEITALPITGVTTGGSFGYTDAKYTNPNAALVAGAGGEYDVTLIPKWTVNLYGQYETEPVYRDARVTFRMDAMWRSRMLVDPNPDIGLIVPEFAPYAYAPATWVVNGRIALEDIPAGPGKATVALWVRNLTDDRSMTFPTGLTTFLRTTSFQPARTFGVDVSFKY